MESWLTDLITQSLAYSLFIIGLISFLESLALIGLLLPGILLMSALGTLIGNGKISFYSAWLASTIGCFLGDWLSYFSGLYCKNWLSRFQFFKKNEKLLDKTKSLLHKHSLMTILAGRFIGPTRPIVPMLAGMLKLSLKKFFLPSTIGCILWPVVYFFPGIITGITINIPNNSNHDLFKWFILIIVFFTIFSIWITSQWWSMKKRNINQFYWFSKKSIGWISIFSILLTIILFISIQFHPTMIIFRKIFLSILLNNY